MRSRKTIRLKFKIYLLTLIPSLFLNISPLTITAQNSEKQEPIITANSDSSNSSNNSTILFQADSVGGKQNQINEKDQSLFDSVIKSDRPYNQINYVVLWLLGDKNVSEFKHRMVDFGKNNLPLSLQNFYFRVVERTYTYPVIILFLLFALILILNVSLVLIVMYFSNKNKNHHERYINIYRSSYEAILSSYLFGEIEWEVAKSKIKRKKRSLNRKILTDLLLTFKENLRGEMDQQIYQIFLNLELEKDSMKLSKSRIYHKRIQGLKALTNLDPDNAKKIIPNYLNDKHFLVRTEAQIAYVRLFPEQPFEFLKTLKTPFPRWTQLSSFYILRLHQVPVPNFTDYLNSEIPTVRNFSLRMIIFFQQLENASVIYNLLDNQVELTRFLAIRAVNDLRLYDGKQKLKDIYNKEPIKNQVEIIKAFKNIGDNEDLEFLETILHSESVSLKTEACRSINYISKEGQERLNMLNQNSELKIDQLLAHVNDSRN